MHLLADETRGAVPVLIKVQQLQRRLLSGADRPTFANAWNWVDAFLQCEYGPDSELYRALRQALMARRAILLLDGAVALAPPLWQSPLALICIQHISIPNPTHLPFCCYRNR